MISYLYGKLVHKAPTYVIVDVGGVGYGVQIPLSSYDKVGDIGGSVKILTYLHVREDVLQLFGFMTQEERELFEMLITVTGVGPKLAQSILSGGSVEDFRRAVTEENLRGLTAIPGVGRKTAQRLVLELKDRLGKVELVPGEPMPATAPDSAMTPVQEALFALVALGFKEIEAQRMVRKVIREEGSDLSVEEMVRYALRMG
jgi:Holliday junction DNA helicase RuvA